ncbi:MAG: biosynthetic-type acetolactate synthase large subunit [Oscillospiraceae bacterium]
MKLTGAQILVQSLLEQGVDVLFGYPGGSVINIYDALDEQRDKVRHILVSHEQGASHAADGYARSTGKTGVALATSGPGATNLVTGIATAYLDSVPMVAITGNVTRPLLGRDSFQEVDIVGVTVPVTKHNFFVNDIDQLADTVKKAFVIANSGRPGPVLIDIPKDITIQSAEYVPAGKFEERPLLQPEETALRDAAQLIEESKKPFIYFGGGIVSSNANDALLRLAKKMSAPMASTAMARACVRYDEPLYLGMMGMHGTPVSNYAAAECDLLICVGARFSDRATGDKNKFASHSKIIHIDIDVTELGKNIPTFLDVVGDARLALEALEQCVAQQDHSAWLQEIKQFAIEHPMPKEDDGDIANPQDVLDAIYDVFGEEAIIVTDVGQHQMITAQHYKFTQPRSFLSSCGLGTMGYGMGAANGAKVAHPERPVVLVTGDGCFHMNMNELAVSVTENLPIVVVIMNNGVLGMVRQWQNLFHGQRHSSTTLNRKTDYVKLAEAFGAEGLRIKNAADIKPILQQASQANGPVVVDCIIPKDEGAFPIIPPGKTMDDIIYDYSDI